MSSTSNVTLPEINIRTYKTATHLRMSAQCRLYAAVPGHSELKITTPVIPALRMFANFRFSAPIYEQRRSDGQTRGRQDPYWSC